MSEIDIIKNKIKNLRSKKSNIETQIDKYEKRKKEISKIIDKLQDVKDDGCEDVNKYVSDISSNLDSGLKGARSVNIINNAIKSHKEKMSDTYLSSAESNLWKELRKIEEEIDELNDDIRSTNDELSSKFDLLKEQKKNNY